MAAVQVLCSQSPSLIATTAVLEFSRIWQPLLRHAMLGHLYIHGHMQVLTKSCLTHNLACLLDRKLLETIARGQQHDYASLAALKRRTLA